MEEEKPKGLAGADTDPNGYMPPPSPAQNVEPEAVPLSQFGNSSKICVFCYRSYSGKQTHCPNCGKRLPAVPIGG